MNKLNLREFAVKMTDEEYHEHPNISYSDINKYIREGFSCLKNLHEHRDTEYFLQGSVIDTLITDVEHFNDKYIIMDEGEVPLGIQNVFNRLIEQKWTSFSSIPLDVIKEAANFVSYRVPSTPETIYKYLAPYSKQYNQQAKAMGKVAITQDMYHMAVKCKQALHDNPLLRFAIFGNENIEIFTQLKFFVEFRGIAYRFMPDIIHVDDINKIVRIYDLKSTKHIAADFPKSYVDYNYWVQQWLYTELMQQILKNHKCDYSVVWGGFIVVSKKDYSALLWNDQTINTALVNSQNVYVPAVQCSYINDKGYVKNPHEYGLEISSYLESNAQYPIWVSQLDKNDISTYFKYN